MRFVKGSLSAAAAEAHRMAAARAAEAAAQSDLKTSCGLLTRRRLPKSRSQGPGQRKPLPEGGSRRERDCRGGQSKAAQIVADAETNADARKRAQVLSDAIKQAGS
jgi:hypothetical protein